MSRFSVKYKLREGDNYENLLQRFGPTVLANASIYEDKDLANNKEITLQTNTEEEAKLLQKKDLEYQRNINKGIDSATYDRAINWAKREDKPSKWNLLYLFNKDRKAYNKVVKHIIDDIETNDVTNMGIRMYGL